MYYTSYFGNIKKIDRSKYVLAAITCSKPAFLDADVLDWSFLGPTKDLLNDYKYKELSEEDYTKRYLKNLSDRWKNIETFMLENADKNIVLLCYEKPPKFCHRHLLANFLAEQKIECEELPYGV